jgi:hypothetical protein
MTPGILNFPPSPYPILNDAWLDQKEGSSRKETDVETFGMGPFP